MARSAGYQLPLASRSPPRLSPPPFCSVPLWTSLGLTFLAVITPPALRPSLCPSRCPSQEGASCPLLPCQSAWVGCGPAPCEARPKPQAGRGQRSSSEARPPGSLPLHPLPGPEDKGASQRSVAVGLRLQEAQPRAGGRGLLSACMSGELGRDLVPGTGLINKFFLCQPGRAGGVMLGGHVHVSQDCLSSV